MLLYMSAVQPFSLLSSIPLYTNTWAPVSRWLPLCLRSMDRKSGFTDLNSETGVRIRTPPQPAPRPDICYFSDFDELAGEKPRVN